MENRFVKKTCKYRYSMQHYADTALERNGKYGVHRDENRMGEFDPISY